MEKFTFEINDLRKSRRTRVTILTCRRPRWRHHASQ